MKNCTKCKKEKDISSFYSKKSVCKDCCRKARNIRYARSQNKRFPIRNILKKVSHEKLRDRIVNNVYQGLRRYRDGQSIRENYLKYFDYSLKELVSHLEKQFTKGMSWKNYGRGGWELDHIIPQMRFRYKSTEDALFKECWSLTNLRPLWRVDNLKEYKRYY